MTNDALIKALRLVIARFDSSVICAYLFGSHARGDAGSRSDIDVAVLFGAAARPGLVGPLQRLQGELERAVRHPVDLVDMRQASPDLLHRILRDGVLLVDNEPLARAGFEVAARNAYFDVLPYLHEYRRGHAS